MFQVIFVQFVIIYGKTSGIENNKGYCAACGRVTTWEVYPWDVFTKCCEVEKPLVYVEPVVECSCGNIIYIDKIYEDGMEDVIDCTKCNGKGYVNASNQ